MTPVFYRSLLQVEKFAKLSRMGRMFYSPGKYLYAVLYRKLWLPFTHATRLKKVPTFFNREILIGFPSGTDIYLSGGKTDDSEIRMTKFLLHNLSPKTCFIDIGAHIGYYSLLADACKSRAVIAVEPSPGNFTILEKNTADCPAITVINKALSDKEETKVLHAFPHVYSEYNTIHPEQFAADRNRPPVTHTITIECTTLDLLLQQTTENNIIVKIDAEGAEHAILQGAKQFLGKHPATIILMEYIDHGQTGTTHQQAVAFMKEMGFTCSYIDASGSLVNCEDVEQYMRARQIKTDNLAFSRKSS